MWINALRIFQNYMGTGLMVIWFLIALVYIFLQESRKPVRILFLYTPVILLLLFFNPIFVNVFYRLAGEDIYFRILWLLPMTVVIAYGIVLSYEKLQGKRKKIYGILAGVVLMASGSLTYSSPLFTRAENLYHVPQTVVEICDRIEIPGREIMAAFPPEFVIYVRQYSPVVRMPFGRNYLMGDYSPLALTMEMEVIDTELLAAQLRENFCHYVILSDDKMRDGNLEDYRFEVFFKINGYTVYKNLEIEFEVPKPQ